MSEKAEAYFSAEQPEILVSRQAIFCECGAPLWTEVISGEEIYIVFERGPVAFHFSGGCPGCGKRLEWHAPEQKLERLVRSRIKQRME
jgi:hypothetical protein